MILKKDEIEEWRGQLRLLGKRLVVTNGCFDLLHVGHVGCLEEASQLGERLLVGCNSDRSVRELKGWGRPINPQNNRATVINALKSVDAVSIFDEKDACDFLALSKPDVYVKGGDYSEYWSNECPVAAKERAVVESYGGSVKLLSLIEGKSTTELIETIKK